MDQAISDFMKSKRALVIEDDPAIAQLLKLNLAEMGLDAEVCGDAKTAENRIAGGYSLVLLDWMLPGVQGIDFLKRNRAKLGSTKLMMITAKADPDSIVEGLESGADDYLPKPFDSRVLAARVRQLMRRLQFESVMTRPQSTESAETKLGDLKIDFAKHVVSLKGGEVHLTPSEFKLLSELIKAQGRVLTRDRLIDLIQGEDVTVTGRTIDTHVFTLRKKIGDWAKNIETIRGVGYRILMSAQDGSEADT